MVVVLVYWAVRGGCLRSAEKKGEKRQRQPQDVEATLAGEQQEVDLAWTRRVQAEIARRKDLEDDEIMRRQQAEESMRHDKEALGRKPAPWRSRTRMSESPSQPLSKGKETEAYTPPPPTLEPRLSPPKRSRRAEDSPIIGQAL
jgi:hypothetical protein